MGLGQTMLTIMALMLMGRTILNMNRTVLDVGFTKDMAEYRISGTSLGTSMVEQVSALQFDEATVNTEVSAANKTPLTAASSLGPEAGETNPDDYDDIDDYNNYVRYDTLSRSATYKTKVKIEYISATSSSVSVTTTKTFSKRITVEVTSPFLVDYSVTTPRPDTLRFQSIFSYWWFR